MRIHAGDGTVWRLGRRRLPWHVRTPWLLRLAGGVMGFDEIALLGLAVAVPVLVYWLLRILLGLLIAPVLAALRGLGWCRHLVVAYRLKSDDKVVEWRRRVDGVDNAGRLVDAAGYLLARPDGPGRTAPERLAALDTPTYRPQ